MNFSLFSIATKKILDLANNSYFLSLLRQFFSDKESHSSNDREILLLTSPFQSPEKTSFSGLVIQYNSVNIKSKLP